jgi:hypothetical protein
VALGHDSANGIDPMKHASEIIQIDLAAAKYKQRLFDTVATLGICSFAIVFLLLVV